MFLKDTIIQICEQRETRKEGTERAHVRSVRALACVSKGVGA
jgi:hypothetical protein